jgi:hypothetical protein
MIHVGIFVVDGGSDLLGSRRICLSLRLAGVCAQYRRGRRTSASFTSALRCSYTSLAYRLLRHVMQIGAEQLDTLNIIPPIELLVDTVCRIRAAAHR